jgi:predicted amidophosphoribosyltransferase
MNIPVLTDVIERRKNTATQTRKSRVERWNNIESKFDVRREAAIINKHVLLIDDVITTGATLEACGSELLKTEGLRLSIAAFAYTLL